MRVDDFNRLLAKIPSLTAAQIETLIQSAQARQRLERGRVVLDEARGGSGCAHCASQLTVKNGTARGFQRYLCRSCGKTFNAVTNTPLSGLHHKRRALEIGSCLARSLTIKQMAAELGVSRSTAHRLRHRFLAEAVAHQPKDLAGIVETDETFLRESQKGSRKLQAPGEPGKSRPPRHHGGVAKDGAKKGVSAKRKDLVPVLVSRARGMPHIGDKVLPALNKATVKDALAGWVGKEALLCTDGSGTLRQAAAELDIPVKYTAVAYEGRVKEGVYHVQSVNRYHQAMKLWINHDRRGVATKYLPNYLAWMRLKEWFKDGLKPEHFIASAIGRQVINTK